MGANQPYASNQSINGVPSLLETRTLFMNLIQRMKDEILKTDRNKQEKIDLLQKKLLPGGDVVRSHKAMNYVINKENEIKGLNNYLIPAAEKVLRNVERLGENSVPSDLRVDLETLIYSTDKVKMTQLYTIKEGLRMKFGDSFVQNAQLNRNNSVSPELANLLRDNPENPFELINARILDLCQRLNINQALFNNLKNPNFSLPTFNQKRNNMDRLAEASSGSSLNALGVKIPNQFTNVEIIQSTQLSQPMIYNQSMGSEQMGVKSNPYKDNVSRYKSDDHIRSKIDLANEINRLDNNYGIGSLGTTNSSIDNQNIYSYHSNRNNNYYQNISIGSKQNTVRPNYSDIAQKSFSNNNIRNNTMKDDTSSGFCLFSENKTLGSNYNAAPSYSNVNNKLNSGQINNNVINKPGFY